MRASRCKSGKVIAPRKCLRAGPPQASMGDLTNDPRTSSMAREGRGRKGAIIAARTGHRHRRRGDGGGLLSAAARPFGMRGVACVGNCLDSQSVAASPQHGR